MMHVIEKMGDYLIGSLVDSWGLWAGGWGEESKGSRRGGQRRRLDACSRLVNFVTQNESH